MAQPLYDQATGWNMAAMGMTSYAPVDRNALFESTWPSPLAVPETTTDESRPREVRTDSAWSLKQFESGSNDAPWDAILAMLR